MHHWTRCRRNLEYWFDHNLGMKHQVALKKTGPDPEIIKILDRDFIICVICQGRKRKWQQNSIAITEMTTYRSTSNKIQCYLLLG